MVEVPVRLRRRAAKLGAAGTRWLTDLPSLLAALERRWSVTLGATLPGGSEAYVARARTSDGEDAVLKVVLPGGDDEEVRTLRAARGHGYVRVLAAEPSAGALLLEALGPSMSDLRLPPERAIPLLCRTLAKAWWAPVDGAAGPGKAEQLADLVTELWHAHGRPCPSAVVDQALGFAERRARAARRRPPVVLHGDPHPGNALRVRALRPGAESGFVFVDPDGFADDPAYDAGVVLRDWSTELLASPTPGPLARHYCRLLATGTGLPEDAIWEWGYLERVSTGLYLLDVATEADATPYLTTAERLLTA